MSALALASASPIRRPRRAVRHPAETATALLLAGGAALFLAAVLAGMLLFLFDRISPAASAILGAIACAGAAGFHLGLAVACIRELGRP